MGYDLEFRFDSNEEYNRDALFDRFCQAGAELIDDPHYDEPVIHISGLTDIWLNKSEAALMDGHWAFFRAPLTTTGLKYLLAFASRAGCKLYNPNPNIKGYVTYNTIDQTMKDIEKDRKYFEKILGKVRFPKEKKL